MNTQSAATIPYLDGWRGLAILLVLYAHFSLSAGGELGVALFFVLSGYLVSGLLFQREVSLATFFWRRATRILPTFWLYLAVVGCYAALWQPVPYVLSWKDIVATLTFLRTYFPEGMSIWSAHRPIGHLWSLNVEEHAYLLLALAAVLLRVTLSRKLMLAFLLACMVAMSMTIFIYSRIPPAGASPWVLRSECAALGLIAAAWIRQYRAGTAFEFVRAGHSVVAPLALGAAVLSYAPWAPYLAAPELAPVFLAISINYLDCAPSLFLRWLSFPILRRFGLCSFSLYIWQQPFYKAMSDHTLAPLLAIAIALLIGFGAFYGFEHPVRRYLNDLWDKKNRPQERPVYGKFTG